MIFEKCRNYDKASYIKSNFSLMLKLQEVDHIIIFLSAIHHTAHMVHKIWYRISFAHKMAKLTMCKNTK
jgi:hypothetical protein